MVSTALFSSEREDWGTPKELFSWAENKLGVKFDLDVAASPENALCTRYYTKEQDGLKQRWSGYVWCNPPYSRRVGEWVEKALSERDLLSRPMLKKAALLLAARTDTKWFHRATRRGAYPIFIEGRIKFVGAKHPAPFPSMLLVFY